MKSKKMASEDGAGYALLLVESPAKAKTIAKYLGEGFRVAASCGHIRDLPTKNSAGKKRLARNISADKKLAEKLGFDPLNGWKANYIVPPEKAAVVKQIKALLKGASCVYLATDPDREGEAIAWHLADLLGLSSKAYKRIVFNSVTKGAILKSLESPRELNSNFVEAQQARRFLDRLVGFMVSPILWEKAIIGLSAGRVQTPSLSMIAEREEEIDRFVISKYKEIYGNFDSAHPIRCKLVKVDGKVFKGIESELVEEICQELDRDLEFTVLSCKERESSLEPPPPFTTATLQQHGSRSLKWSVKRVMGVAQKLYEHGHITYMRTDSVHIASDSIEEMREWIKDRLPSSYQLAHPRVFKSKKLAQEAHEAIRPTNFLTDHQKIAKALGIEASKLYKLIFGRAVASQISSAKVKQVKVVMEGGGHRKLTFEYTGKQLVFDGWTRLEGTGISMPSSSLPDLKSSLSLKLSSFEVEDRETSPPARFTEAKLVKELERKGIGRPSTYAPIMEAIVERGYVKLSESKFYAERLGRLIVKRLNRSFPDIFSYEFTSLMEEQLDEIARGVLGWKDLLDSFYLQLSDKVLIARGDPSDGGMQAIEGFEVDELCQRGLHRSILKLGSFGFFLKCSDLTCDSKPVKLIEECNWPTVGRTNIEQSINNNRPCVSCGSSTIPYSYGSSSTILFICNMAPDCRGVDLVGLDGPIWRNEERLEESCLSCGEGHYRRLIGRFGPYVECEICKDRRKWVEGKGIVNRISIPFEEVKSLKHPGAWFYLREGSSGLFFASNLFPKIRECRPPKISELQGGIDRLPESWKRYANLTAADPNGNPTYLRFNKKEGRYYLASRVEEPDGRWSTYKVWVEFDD